MDNNDIYLNSLLDGSYMKNSGTTGIKSVVVSAPPATLSDRVIAKAKKEHNDVLAFVKSSVEVLITDNAVMGKLPVDLNGIVYKQFSKRCSEKVFNDTILWLQDEGFEVKREHRSCTIITIAWKF